MEALPITANELKTLNCTLEIYFMLYKLFAPQMKFMACKLYPNKAIFKKEGHPRVSIILRIIFVP